MRFTKFLTAAAAVLTMTGGALAADLPTMKGPPAYMPPPPPFFTWAGLYVGGQVGYAWGHVASTLVPAVPLPPIPSYSPTGVIGGAHIGYNWQMGPLVYGLEGDVDGSSYKGNAMWGPFLGLSTRYPVQGSIRGRLGYAFDHVLLYATGGAAFASITETLSIPIIAYTESHSRARVGWTVGGGLEYAIDNNWSVRGEYRYTNYGTFSDPINFAPAFSIRKTEDEHRVQVGFSYKFDFMAPSPVVAKY